MEHLYSCIVCREPLQAREERLHCKRCNLLFIHTHVHLRGLQAEVTLPEQPEEEIEEPFEETPEPEGHLFVRSEKSESYHLPPCKYAKRIEDPVWIGEAETGGLRACGCVKRNR